jgi:hypothetical protein
MKRNVVCNVARRAAWYKLTDVSEVLTASITTAIIGTRSQTTVGFIPPP